VVGLPGYRRGDGTVVLIRGGRDGYGEGGHVLGVTPKGERQRFSTAVALVHLAGGSEAPDLVVVVEVAGFDALVQITPEGKAPTKLPGLARAADDDSGEKRLGLTAGA
jgi:hypothetical protein